MGIVQETIKGVMATVSNVSSITCPCYFDHAPQTLTDGSEAKYPIIIINAISSPRTYSMLDDTNYNHTYARVRIQFRVFGNEDQQQEAMDISDILEDTFKFKIGGSIGNANIRWIGTYINDQNIKFFEEGEKIWSINTDMIFVVTD